MNTFEWIDATSVEQAAGLLAESSDKQPMLAKAGGLDLLDLMKEGILQPSRLVNLQTIKGLDKIEANDDGLTLGTLVTLSQIESDKTIAEKYPALAAAAGHAATPQVRNAASIGGNLLQRPRSWYYRLGHFHGKGVTDNPLAVIRDGQNQYEGIFDTDVTPLVHASTPATALVAYDASVELTSADGKTRTVKLADFLKPPTFTTAAPADIKPGEVITRVMLPSNTSSSAYHKQTERESYDWPICDVAVVLGDQPRIVMGWVAPTPRRATEAEQLLAGKEITEDLAAKAAAAAVASAKPLKHNAYKVKVLETVLKRTILNAAGIKTPTW